MEAVEEKMIRGLDRLLLFDDILVNVLSKLPVKSLLRFRCVCKRWLYIISEDPLLIQLHSHQFNSKPHLVFLSYPSHFEDDTWVITSTDMERNPISRFEFKIGRQCYLKLLPTHFDLVCIYGENIICICNPSTHELVTLPPLPSFLSLPHSNMGYEHPNVGLGYVESTDEYKVVCLIPVPVWGISVDDYSITTKCLVFNLGGSTSSSSSSPSWAWRDVMNCPYQVSSNIPPAFANGSLHWLPPYYVEEPMFDPENPILAFDVETEEFRRLPQPKGCPDLRSFPCEVTFQLVEVRGLLCLPCLKEKTQMDIWMLKDYKSGTWIKEYSIDLNVVPDSSYYGCDYYFGFTLRDIDETKVLIDCEGVLLGYYHLQSPSFKDFIFHDEWEDFSFYKVSFRSLEQLQGKALKQNKTDHEQTLGCLDLCF